MLQGLSLVACRLKTQQDGASPVICLIQPPLDPGRIHISPLCCCVSSCHHRPDMRTLERPRMLRGPRLLPVRESLLLLLPVVS